MAELLTSKLAEEHAQELLRMERHELETLAKLYEEARIDLLGRLADLADRGRADTFTAQHMRGTLAQIQAGIRAMTVRLRGKTSPALEAAAETGLRQTLAEIAFWERARGFGEGPIRRIQTSALRSIATRQELLVEALERSVAAYGEHLIGELHRRLGLHLVQRSSWTAMSGDIARHVTGSQWRAERIVRTELVNALNLGHQSTLETVAAEALPDLRRQWDAHLDERTSGICRDLNGQVVGVREPFKHDGREFPHPPGHPNCRSRVVPWRAAWTQ